MDAPGPDSRPPARSDDDRLAVVVDGVFQYPRGAVFVQLRAEDGRLFPLWLSGESWEAIQREVSGEPPPRPITADFAADLVRVLDGSVREVWVYGERDGVFLARTVLQGAAGSACVECRPSDGIALALRFAAPVLVSRALFERFGGAPFPPGNWQVEDRAEPATGLLIRHAPYPLRKTLTDVGAFLLVAGALTGGLWSLSLLFGAPLFLFSLVLVRLIPLLLGPLVVRERWLVDLNSLEVTRSLLGFRESRRYLGATLHLVRDHPRDRAPGSLWVSERGRRRKLADSFHEDDLAALGSFLSARTGWPLVNE